MVIIYNTLTEAQALSFRLSGCKSVNDTDYTRPITNKTGDSFAVQVLSVDHEHLTAEEQSSLMDLPADWFNNSI